MTLNIVLIVAGVVAAALVYLWVRVRFAERARDDAREERDQAVAARAEIAQADRAQDAYTEAREKAEKPSRAKRLRDMFPVIVALLLIGCAIPLKNTNPAQHVTIPPIPSFDPVRPTTIECRAACRPLGPGEHASDGAVVYEALDTHAEQALIRNIARLRADACGLRALLLALGATFVGDGERQYREMCGG